MDSAVVGLVLVEAQEEVIPYRVPAGTGLRTGDHDNPVVPLLLLLGLLAQRGVLEQPVLPLLVPLLDGLLLESVGERGVVVERRGRVCS